MIHLALSNLLRRPLRSLITGMGVAAATAVFTCLVAFEGGYEGSLRKELDRMGFQLMVVPLGCPYDAAARVLKAKSLENTLPEAAITAIRRDPAVAVAAPLLLAALVRTGEQRTEMWVGLDESAVLLKPWWRVAAGTNWFDSLDSVILGCDAAEIEMRAPGDSFYSPEKKHVFRVAGTLERSGTSDDSVFFVPLRTAQSMFGQAGRITAVAVRLHDPGQLREATARLQQIPGAQVVTIAEITGVFLNLVGVARSLIQGLSLMALAVCVLSVSNTLLAGVIERAGELSVLRALGASRVQLLVLITVEGLLITGLGSAAGLALAGAGQGVVEAVARRLVAFAPEQPMMGITAQVIMKSAGLAAAVGLIGGLFPAWRASTMNPAAALKAT